MQMNKKLPVLYIIIIVLIVLIGAGFVFTHLSLKEKIADGKAVLAQKQRETVVLKKKIQELNELSATIYQLRNRKGSYEGLIPESVDLPGVIRQLEVAAERSNVSILNLTFTDKDEATEVPSIIRRSCDMTIIGKYGSLLNFIQALKNSPRLIGVRGVGVGTNNEDTDLQFKITAEIYYEAGPNQETKVK